jgi:hypothetical protein
MKIQQFLLFLCISLAYSCHAQFALGYYDGYISTTITFDCHGDTCISNEMSSGRKIAKIPDRRKCFDSQEALDPMKEMFGGALYGYSDSAGKIIIPFQFEFVTPFFGDYALVTDTEQCSGKGPSNRMHHIRRNGTSPYQQRYSHVLEYINGYAIVEEKGNYDFYHIDTFGRRIYPQKYLRLTPYSSKGYALGQKALDSLGIETWALINKKGTELVIKRVRDEAEILTWFSLQGY